MGTEAQCTHHVGTIGLDRAQAEEQPGGDFGVGVAYLHVGNKKGSLQAATYSPRGSPPKYHRRWRA
jgi:hypothetical protein